MSGADAGVGGRRARAAGHGGDRALEGLPARPRPPLHAVRDVSFNLYRGAVVALVGESGSGKSTVARLLAGQEHLTSGSIRLDGAPVDLSGQRAFRRYKSDGPDGLPGPVRLAEPGAHRALPPRAPGAPAPGRKNSRRGGPGDRRPAGAGAAHPGREVPAQVPARAVRRPAAAGLVRPGARRPAEVLLADEPVSMLDVSIRLEMLSLLDDLRRRFQLALLYITHDIASARYFADEVLVMYAGQIVERGPAEDAHPAAGAPLHPAAGRLCPRSRQSRQRAARRHRAAATAGAGAAPDRRPRGCPFSTRCPFADDRCRSGGPAAAADHPGPRRRLLAPGRCRSCAYSPAAKGVGTLRASPRLRTHQAGCHRHDAQERQNDQEIARP